MREKITQIHKGELERSLNLFDLFAIGYGDLGSSIYYALGITALYALGAAPLALLTAGLVFVCTALTYAEMSSVIQEAGGSASYSRKTFNDFISFIAGWGLLLDYIVTISISSFAIAPYLSYFFPILKEVWPQVVLTVVIIFALAILNILGNKHSTRLSLVLTALTLITQLVIIVIGLFFLVNLPTLWRHFTIGGPNTLWSPTWGEFIHGVAMAMVAYTGIESMAQLSSEAKEPAKTVPRAIVLSMCILMFMYLGVSIVALSAMTPQTLSTTYLNNPIAGIVQALPFGQAVLLPWVAALAAVILAVAANAGLIGASRLSLNMGEHFQLPKMFYNIHKKHKTPYVALWVFAIFASCIVVLSWGKLSFLADLYNFGAMLAFFCTHLTLIMHRIRFPNEKRPFFIKGNIPFRGAKIPITAILGLVATFSVWCLVVYAKPDGRYLGIGWIVIGLIMYFWYRKQQNIAPLGKLEIEKVHVDNYKDIQVKKVLLPTGGHIATDTVVVGCNLAKLFQAELVVIHIVEIPYILPIQTPLLQKMAYSESVLQRAEAIAREKDVKVEIRTLRARSIVKKIVEIAEQESFDLVVLGCRGATKFGPITEQIMEKVKTRVWVCRPADKGFFPDVNADLFQDKSSKE